MKFTSTLLRKAWTLAKQAAGSASAKPFFGWALKEIRTMPEENKNLTNALRELRLCRERFARAEDTAKLAMLDGFEAKLTTAPEGFWTALAAKAMTGKDAFLVMLELSKGHRAREAEDRAGGAFGVADLLRTHKLV